jgi:hypothetical protein
MGQVKNGTSARDLVKLWSGKQLKRPVFFAMISSGGMIFTGSDGNLLPVINHP